MYLGEAIIVDGPDSKQVSRNAAAYIKGCVVFWGPQRLQTMFLFLVLFLRLLLLVRERSALATLIFTSRVCLSFVLSFVLSVRNFGVKYLGNEAR